MLCRFSSEIFKHGHVISNLHGLPSESGLCQDCKIQKKASTVECGSQNPPNACASLLKFMHAIASQEQLRILFRMVPDPETSLHQDLELQKKGVIEVMETPNTVMMHPQVCVEFSKPLHLKSSFESVSG